MDLKNNIAEQKEYLERNLEQLNTVVSAILGYKTDIFIKEIKQGDKIYLKVVDDRNIREQCGVMAKAFSEIIIKNFGMWWSENGVCMDLQFSYEHIDGGSNGAKFCTISIVNDLVTIV